MYRWTQLHSGEREIDRERVRERKREKRKSTVATMYSDEREYFDSYNFLLLSAFSASAFSF